jgi:hypothetical protein
MHGLSNPEMSGFEVTLLDGDLGAVTDLNRTAAPTACPACWPACFVCCADALADE